MNRNHISVLLVPCLLFTALLHSSTSHTSGQYNHVHMADSAIDRLKEAELEHILTDRELLIFDRRELFKNGALFPDSQKYNYFIKPQDLKGNDNTNLHRPDFYYEYSKAIQERCFSKPVPPLPPNKYCAHRQDLSCNTLNLNCEVENEVGTSRICSNSHEACDLLLGGLPGCPGAAGTCLEVGVCTANMGKGAYTTQCAKGALPSDCPGTLNRCVDDYGRCKQSKLSNTCEKMITHFMGALAHFLTDTHADNFFMRSVLERTDCPSEFFLSEETVKAQRAVGQYYTDQHMDAYIALHGLGEEFVRDLFPKDLARLQVPTDELYDVLTNSCFYNNDGEFHCFYGASDLDLTLAMQENLAKFKAVPECGDRLFDVTLSGLNKEELEQFILNDGHACEVPVYIPIEKDNCAWAIEEDNWYHEGGGTLDTANYIAEVLDRSWRFMRNQKVLKFGSIGSQGDRHVCVGAVGGKDCLLEKGELITGTDFESLTNYDTNSTSVEEASWSDWGAKRHVDQIDSSMSQGILTFSLQGSALSADLGPDGTCTNDPDPMFDMILDISSTFAQDKTKRLTDTLLTAFVAAIPVQVRTELSQCSESPGHYLVRDVRFDAQDGDGDGSDDDNDNCPIDPNPDQADVDGDGTGDACDSCPIDPFDDEDGDGSCGNIDNCPLVANLGQANLDGDAVGDVCDSCPLDQFNDSDGDGICGDVDNCPYVANVGQLDRNGDGRGSACDPYDDRGVGAFSNGFVTLLFGLSIAVYMRRRRNFFDVGHQ